MDQPIARVDHKLGKHDVRDDGKLAQTIFKRLHYNGHTSLVHCQPLTGRTHQIRVHLRWLVFAFPDLLFRIERKTPIHTSHMLHVTPQLPPFENTGLSSFKLVFVLRSHVIHYLSRVRLGFPIMNDPCYGGRCYASNSVSSAYLLGLPDSKNEQTEGNVAAFADEERKEVLDEVFPSSQVVSGASIWLLPEVSCNLFQIPLPFLTFSCPPPCLFFISFVLVSSVHRLIHPGGLVGKGTDARAGSGVGAGDGID